ncbi:MAG TPA: DUF305 domain-containing protein [Blastocatellia bacterium]|nr:DUF305 domain-containing protein [Blastocatellia bacterium]
MKLTTLRITLTAISILGFPAVTRSGDSQSQTDAAWSELNASMDKMHMAMEAVKQSGDSDVDFVRLMLPHHEAAIDMAKSELLHGKDPQMLRLAQEIITDQQSEIQLMEQWLKARESVRSKENDKPTPGTEKGN